MALLRTITICTLIALVSLGFYYKSHPKVLEIEVYRKPTYSFPSKFDPINVLETSEHALSNLIYDGLFYVNDNMEVLPSLVADWNLSKDGKTYIFTLRKDVIFHNGDKLNVDHIIVFFKKLLAPNSPVKTTFDRIINVKKLSNESLAVEINSPYPPFISLLASPAAKVSIDVGQTYNLGTGPFKFKEITNIQGKEVLILMKNENYFRNVPNIKEMQLWKLNEEEVFSRINEGFFHDTAIFSFSGKNKISIEPSMVKNESLGSSTWVIAFNTQKFPTNNLDLRSCIVDNFKQDEFIKKFIPNHQKALGYLPISLLGSKLEKLRRESNCESFSEKTLTFLYPDVLEQGQEMCVFFKENYNKLNINCESLEFTKLLDRMKHNDYQLAFLSMTLEMPDVEYFFNTFEKGSVFNLSSYSSPLIDQLLNESRLNPDRMKRSSLYAKINQHLYNNSVTLNISYPKLLVYRHSCLKNFNMGLAGEIYIDYTKVSIDSNCKFKEHFGLMQ